MIRINCNRKFRLDQSELGLIQIENLVSDSFGLLPRINRIRSDRFFTVFHQTSYKTFFGLVRDDSHWLGCRYRNESE